MQYERTVGLKSNASSAFFGNLKLLSLGWGDRMEQGNNKNNFL